MGTQRAMDPQPAMKSRILRCYDFERVHQCLGPYGLVLSFYILCRMIILAVRAVSLSVRCNPTEMFPRILP